MRYRCRVCGSVQWRGFFPEATFHMRFAVFHGLAIGVSVVTTKVLFARLGLGTTGWRDGTVSLAVTGILLLGAYGVAVLVERGVVSRCRCGACGERALRPE